MSADPVTALAVRPDGHVLAVGRMSGTLQVFDLVDGMLVATRLQKAAPRVRALAFDPRGERLAVAGAEGCVTLWDAETVRPLERIDAEPNGRTLSVAFDRTGSIVATVGDAGFPRLWDARTGALLWCDEGKHPDGRGNAIGYIGDRLLVGFEHGPFGYWDPSAEGPGPDGAPRFGRPRGLSVFGHALYAFATHPSQRIVAVGGDHGEGVVFFRVGDAEKWLPTSKIKVPRPMAVNAVAFSPDGSRVAAACSDGVVRLTNDEAIATERTGDGYLYTIVEETLGREIHRGWTTEAIVSSVAFVANDFLASGHFDGSVRVWIDDARWGSWRHHASLSFESDRVQVHAPAGDAEARLAWADVVAARVPRVPPTA